ncbi:RNA ligase family protein [Nocardia puris]|uniref:RNA ligase n=1 Tax=Nocardia puris TaxID=208602 RepID=A0A366DPY1_9NOCA|nr:RNA ligase family protein [Nocardia puris]RBO91334.1 RNA ligase [Nocardia puris]
MHLPRPKNDEYAAVVVRVPTPVPLLGRDRVVGVPVLGRQAIVPKYQIHPGQLALMFPTEVQLGPEYAKAANLFRDSALNADPSVVGYLEPNRRVRAIRIGGHRSDALLLPLETLTALGLDAGLLAEGDIFDKFADIEICRKYIPPQTGRALNAQPRTRVRVVERHFPEHLDTGNYWRLRASKLLDEDDEIVVTQKLHGTSIRVGMVPVQLPRPVRPLTRLARWFADRAGVPIQTYEYAPVYGSRRVVKGTGRSNHHYTPVDGVDLWTRHGRMLDGLLPEGVLVFGELIGWADSHTPIQRGYTYRIDPGKAEMYVYRVARINAQGYLTDLVWDQLEEACATYGLVPVPVLWRGRAADFTVEDWMDRRYHDEGYVQAVRLDAGSLPDEGVVIRRDRGAVPLLLKAKSAEFLRYETGQADAGRRDIETAESTVPEQDSEVAA